MVYCYCENSYLHELLQEHMAGELVTATWLQNPPNERMEISTKRMIQRWLIIEDWEESRMIRMHDCLWTMESLHGS